MAMRIADTMKFVKYNHLKFIGVCRIVILLDSRIPISVEFQFADTGYLARYPVLPDTGYQAIKGIYCLISYLSY